MSRPRPVVRTALAGALLLSGGARLPVTAVTLGPTRLALDQVAAVLADQQAGLRTSIAAWDGEDLERFAVLLDRFADSLATGAAEPAGAPSVAMSDTDATGTPDDTEQTVPDEQPTPGSAPDARADAGSAPALQPRDGGHDGVVRRARPGDGGGRPPCRGARSWSRA